MNILPHKSWHVRNRNNIERVRKDEEKAAEEEKERQRRIALAEQEARTDLLRQRAKVQAVQDKETCEAIPCLEQGQDTSRKRKHNELTPYQDGSLATDIYSGSDGHINFFADVEGGLVKDKKNAAHEAEKKKEKEDFEKKMGILTYLGQSATESPEPWYAKRRKTEDKDTGYDRNEHKNRKLKDTLDPIHTMNEYVRKKKHKHKDKSDKHKHKHHMHKDKKKGKEEKKEVKVHCSKSIEQLRAERLKRETEERKKTALLMAKVRGEKLPSESVPTEINDRERRYNSQYNPDFARKPRHKN